MIRVLLTVMLPLEPVLVLVLILVPPPTAAAAELLLLVATALLLHLLRAAAILALLKAVRVVLSPALLAATRSATRSTNRESPASVLVKPFYIFVHPSFSLDLVFIAAGARDDVLSIIIFHTFRCVDC